MEAPPCGRRMEAPPCGRRRAPVSRSARLSQAHQPSRRRLMSCVGFGLRGDFGASQYPQSTTRPEFTTRSGSSIRVIARLCEICLVAGCWLLVAGCWLLVAGCWPGPPGARLRAHRREEPHRSELACQPARFPLPLSDRRCFPVALARPIGSSRTRFDRQYKPAWLSGPPGSGGVSGPYQAVPRRLRAPEPVRDQGFFQEASHGGCRTAWYGARRPGTAHRAARRTPARTATQVRRPGCRRPPGCARRRAAGTPVQPGRRQCWIHTLRTPDPFDRDRVASVSSVRTISAGPGVASHMAWTALAPR
jgi:hypothetical protein